MFKLFRYFSIASLLALAVVVVVLGAYFRQFATREMTATAESLNVALTHTFANSLWPSITPFVAASSHLEPEEMQAHPEVKRIRSEVLDLMHGQSVLKVKIYNLDGMTIFSTEEAQIGQSKLDNAGFVAARQGVVATELTHRDSFSAFEQEIEDRDVLSSYVPIHSERDVGRVEGVFELYVDVTPLLERIAERQRRVWLTLTTIMTLLYGALLVVIRRADRILRAQYDERERAEDALREQEADLRMRGMALAEAIESLQHEIAERERTEAAMLRAQKLESIGVLAGGVAHDFNNLLSGILGQSEVALVKLAQDAPSRVHVERAIKAAERAATLTQQLLAYGGQGTFLIEPIDLNAVILENSELLEVTLPKHATLGLDLTEGLPPIIGDKGQVQQIVMNLIHNAAEAIEAGSGRVDVRTYVETLSEPVPGTAAITGQALPSGSYVGFEVKDDGSGIASENLSAIFEPFFTSKPAGRGLGLAAVIGIVRRMGGDITVESEVGHGSTFRLRLPAAHPDTAPAIEGPGFAPLTGPLRVLVVDDEDHVRRALHDMLDTRGIEIIDAESGERGIEAFATEHATIDVVILDLTMPGLSGTDTFRALREIDPLVRIVLTSGYSQARVESLVTGDSRTCFVRKPMSMSKLGLAMASLLAESGPADRP